VAGAKRSKAPSSAKFGGDDTVNTGDRWVVSGYVDAQNAFGASLRSPYTCHLRVAEDVWTLDNLEFADGSG